MKAEDRSNAGNLTFFVYCRKSSEDDRQAASIGDQLRELRAVIKREKLQLGADPFREEMSAKAPGRPIFSKMIDRIEEGEATALLCWDIDRLYRNPVDEGRVRWLLQRGIIREIRTPFRTYHPQDAGLLMGVEGGRATDHIITLRKGVLRGFRGKLERGQRPGRAPLGYLNNTDPQKGERTIIPDPDRFDLIRRAWELILTGRHSVREIQEKADEEWGLRTRRTKKQGGKPITVSGWYRIFSKPFYAGTFWWKIPGTKKRKLYQGSHTPMISQREFDRVQVILGTGSTPSRTPRSFPYRGALTCGECGASVTAEEKRQIICPSCKVKFSSPNKEACPNCDRRIAGMTQATRLRYVYYHCTKRKRRDCTQRSIRESALEEEILGILSRIKATPRLTDWGLRAVQEQKDKTRTQQQKARKSRQIRERTLRKELDHINAMILSPDTDWRLITPDEIHTRKLELGEELKRLQEKREEHAERSKSVLQLTKDTFSFAAHAYFWFREGTDSQKRAIYTALGSNPTLKGRKLRLNLRPPLKTLSRLRESWEACMKRFEPSKERMNKRESPALRTMIPILRGACDEVRTYWEENPDAEPLPIIE